MSTRSGADVAYLSDKLRRPADTEARQRLRSASAMSLAIQHTWLSIVADRAFPTASARLWNSLPSHVTAIPSLSTFCSHLKSHLEVTRLPLFSARAVTCHFGNLNRST